MRMLWTAVAIAAFSAILTLGAGFGAGHWCSVEARDPMEGRGGGRYLQEINVARAQTACRLASVLRPDEARTHYRLGRALEAAGSRGAALREYDKGARLGDPLSSLRAAEALQLPALEAISVTSGDAASILASAEAIARAAPPAQHVERRARYLSRAVAQLEQAVMDGAPDAAAVDARVRSELARTEAYYRHYAALNVLRAGLRNTQDDEGLRAAALLVEEHLSHAQPGASYPSAVDPRVLTALEDAAKSGFVPAQLELAYVRAVTGDSQLSGEVAPWPIDARRRMAQIAQDAEALAMVRAAADAGDGAALYALSGLTQSSAPGLDREVFAEASAALTEATRRGWIAWEERQ